MSGVVRIRHRALWRGRTPVLEAGGMDVPVGATVGVVGANGAGKSTLLLSIAGVLARHPADVRLTTAGGRSAVAGRVGLALQEPALPAWLEVPAAAALCGPGLPALAAAAPGLRLAELPRRPVRALSGGHRQALAVALAIASGARVRVLDEPFSALDLVRRRGLLDDLARQSADDGATTFLSSQAGAELDAACSHFFVLAGGRCVFAGTRASLLRTAGALAAAAGDAERLERAILARIEGAHAPAPAGGPPRGLPGRPGRTPGSAR